nr:sulfite exporter TauE/SafE family protein [Natronocella acetinitrilica]
MRHQERGIRRFRLYRAGSIDSAGLHRVRLFRACHAISPVILVLTALLILNVTVRKTDRRDRVAGGASGMLTAAIGMPGPPILLYFAGSRLEKSLLRGTSLGCVLYIYSLALFLQILFGSTNATIWWTALALVPVTLFGTWLGERLFHMVSQALSRMATYVILMVTDAYLLYTSLSVIQG